MLEGISEVISQLLTTANVDSFIGDFPSLDSSGLCIVLAEGDPPIRHFGESAPVLYMPRIVLNAKSMSFETAETLLLNARMALDGKTATGVKSIYTDGTVTYGGRDDMKYHTLSMDYKIIIEE